VFSFLRALFLSLAANTAVRAALGAFVSAVLLGALQFIQSPEGLIFVGSMAWLVQALSPSVIEIFKRKEPAPQLPSSAVFHKPGDGPGGV
jgi:hypothetical protein